MNDDFINDAFEVALVDVDGNSLVNTFASGRDAFYNVAEGMEPVFGAGVVIDDTTVTVGLDGIPTGTEAMLIFRLVNNDKDTTTAVQLKFLLYENNLQAVTQQLNSAIQAGQKHLQVTNISSKSKAITSGDIQSSRGIAFAQAFLQGNTFEFTAYASDGRSVSAKLKLIGVQHEPGAVNFNQFVDITGSFDGVYRRTSFNDQITTLHVDLATRNDGTFAVDVPFLIGVTNISDPTVLILDVDGITPDGIPYYDYTNRIPGGRLGPGELSESPTISFHNPDHVQFDYELVFFSRVNRPPMITSIPATEAFFANNYTYNIAATDSDGDELTYTLRIAPSTMEIEADTGKISWNPSIEDIGIHHVTLTVVDGRGGSAHQDMLSLLPLLLLIVRQSSPVFQLPRQRYRQKFLMSEKPLT